MRILLPIALAACLGACRAGTEDAGSDNAAPGETPQATPAASPAPSPAGLPSSPPSPAPPPATTGRVSRYTSLDACRVVRSAPEEAGFAESSCPGLGGYRLKLIEADGRQNLTVVSGSAEHNLRLPSVSGGGFSELGDRIEWRGREEGGTFRPDALILRYAVVEDADRPTQPTSYLLPVSLDRTPCLSAKIRPGPGQNDRARAAIDGARHCL